MPSSPTTRSNVPGCVVTVILTFLARTCFAMLFNACAMRQKPTSIAPERGKSSGPSHADGDPRKRRPPGRGFRRRGMETEATRHPDTEALPTAAFERLFSVFSFSAFVVVNLLDRT